MSNVALDVLVAALREDPRRRGTAVSRPIGTLTNSTHSQPSVLGQHAAEQHAGRAAGAGDRAPDAERLVALGALGERGRDDRQRGGGDERGAEALHGAGGDQPDLGLREAAEQRGEREERPCRR